MQDTFEALLVRSECLLPPSARLYEPACMRITQRDREILTAMAWKVRLFSLAQIAAHWWNNSRRSTSLTAARMGILEAAGYVRRRRVLARPLPPIEHPVATWNPTEAAPCFGRVSYKLRTRWQGAATATTVYVLGHRARGLWGGASRRRLSYPLQVTHDLGVAAMYLILAKASTQMADSWVGEDALPKKQKQKIPDAALIPTHKKKPAKLLEFGGDYDKRRLEAFHRYAASIPLPYEIW